MRKTFNLPCSEWEHLIDEWIFSERDRAIIKRKMLDDITYDTLSNEFFLSVQQLKKIVKDGYNEMVKHIKHM